MVAEAPAAAKKVRVNGPNGTFRWVYPEEAAAINPQARAAADLLAGERLDWEGNEVELPDETYDEYINRLPSKAELRKFKTPRRYWEVRYPGCAIQPYPLMGAMASTESGLWQAWNEAQDRAIREHIALTAQIDPDELLLSEHDWAVMSGRAKGGIRYCQNAGCRFVSCAATAFDLHESLTGHRTDSRPKKDD